MLSGQNSINSAGMTHLSFIAGVIGGWEIILWLFLLALVAFPIWMIVDCANHETKFKGLWVAAIFLTGPIAALVYCVSRKLPRAETKTSPPPS